MGHELQATCLDCGRIFTVCHGGGFIFHLLRCDKCGKTKSIGFDELGELHLRYSKGLPEPFGDTDFEHEGGFRKHTSAEPISKDEYHHGIEAVAGECRCGGKYTLDSPPRCPKCRSMRLNEGDITVFYD